MSRCRRVLWSTSPQARAGALAHAGEAARAASSARPATDRLAVGTSTSTSLGRAGLRSSRMDGPLSQAAPIGSTSRPSWRTSSSRVCREGLGARNRRATPEPSCSGGGHNEPAAIQPEEAHRQPVQALLPVGIGDVEITPLGPSRCCCSQAGPSVDIIIRRAPNRRMSEPVVLGLAPGHVSYRAPVRLGRCRR